MMRHHDSSSPLPGTSASGGVGRGAGVRFPLTLAVALLVAACATGSGDVPNDSARSDLASATPPTASPTSISVATASATLAPFGDGPLDPGRYVLLPMGERWAGDPCERASGCPSVPPVARTLQVEIDVPPGWQAGFEGTILMPVPPGSTEGPDGSGFAIGWTGLSAGLHSDPCLPEAHGTPDIPVGPTVDEFIEAVVAHPTLQATEPRDVELGGYPGRFLTITAPADISDCYDWRPWEPGFAAQGPDNLWSVWAIDVEGLRMILVTEAFPATPATDQAALRSIVGSVRFVP